MYNSFGRDHIMVSDNMGNARKRKHARSKDLRPLMRIFKRRERTSIRIFKCLTK